MDAGAMCCKTLSPSVLYVEFLNAWINVKQNWDNEKIKTLIRRCLNSYLFPNKNRGCVFFNYENNQCRTLYSKRI